MDVKQVIREPSGGPELVYPSNNLICAPLLLDGVAAAAATAGVSILLQYPYYVDYWLLYYCCSTENRSSGLHAPKIGGTCKHGGPCLLLNANGCEIFAGYQASVPV